MRARAYASHLDKTRAISPSLAPAWLVLWTRIAERIGTHPSGMSRVLEVWRNFTGVMESRRLSGGRTPFVHVHLEGYHSWASTFAVRRSFFF